MPNTISWMLRALDFFGSVKKCFLKFVQNVFEMEQWKQFPWKPYNKSFIDQTCPVKMAHIGFVLFFGLFMDLDSVSVHKHAKKELGQYPAILTSHLINNPSYISWLSSFNNLSLGHDAWFLDSYVSTFPHTQQCLDCFWLE